jgi:hypothetical protein
LLFIRNFALKTKKYNIFAPKFILLKNKR